MSRRAVESRSLGRPGTEVEKPSDIAQIRLVSVSAHATQQDLGHYHPGLGVYLYLVRHAIAEPHDSARWPDDSQRPLTAAGIERFRGAARGLRLLGIEIDAMLASPYVRAWHTAELLSAEAAWPFPETCPTLEPPTPPTACLDALQDRREASLALVGHQPLLSELASLLLVGDERLMRLELKKGGAMCLRFADRPVVGTAALRWSVSPKILGSLGR